MRTEIAEALISVKRPEKLSVGHTFELAPARQRTESTHTPLNSLTQLSRASTQAREPRLALINARVHTRSPFSALASTSIRSTLSHTPPQNARALSLTSQEDDIATHLSLLAQTLTFVLRAFAR